MQRDRFGFFFSFSFWLVLFAITAFALEGGVKYDDAMEDILADETLNKSKIESYLLENDGYLGIPVEFTYYFDNATFGSPKAGHQR